MKNIIWLTLLLLIPCLTQSQITQPEASEVWEPQPRKVSISENGIPADAIVLFDGKSLEQWESRKDSSAAMWTINQDGSMSVKPGAGDIQTKQVFGSIQLHLEWRAPDVIVGEGQGRGNSGVFFQGRYEVQVLDNYNNQTYANGQAGAIYKQSIPLVNACKAPGEWQTYDILFDAPVFNADGIKIKSGYLTVFHNGIVIQNHVEIQGTTEYIGFPKNMAHGEDKIILQDHSNPVSYRNIWLRKL
jgi:hypothetical protein